MVASAPLRRLLNRLPRSGAAQVGRRRKGGVCQGSPTFPTPSQKSFSHCFHINAKEINQKPAKKNKFTIWPLRGVPGDFESTRLVRTLYLDEESQIIANSFDMPAWDNFVHRNVCETRHQCASLNSLFQVAPIGL